MDQDQQIRASALSTAAQILGPYIAARAEKPDQIIDTAYLDLPELARQIALCIRDGIPTTQNPEDRKDEEWCGTCNKETRMIRSGGLLGLDTVCEQCPTERI
ncbi:hypothetical protein ACH4OX_33205 [Streptomyces roseolus]|uniref:hypothetical protein n=1 Tax=Streptomyces roseolus TaxID=67358 RepID=UPI0037A5A222